MAREPDNYRAELELLCAKFPQNLLTVEQVAEYCGVPKARVTRLFPLGWTGKRKGKMISRQNLAKQLSR